MRPIRLSLLALTLLLVFAGLCQAQPYVPDPEVYSKIKGAYQPIGLVGRRLMRKDWYWPIRMLSFRGSQLPQERECHANRHFNQ